MTFFVLNHHTPRGTVQISEHLNIVTEAEADQIVQVVQRIVDAEVTTEIEVVPDLAAVVHIVIVVVGDLGVVNLPHTPPPLTQTAPQRLFQLFNLKTDWRMIQVDGCS